MQESNARRSAVIFTVTVILLAVVLFGGVYFLKQRDNSTPERKNPPTSQPEKTEKNDKTSKKTNPASSENKNDRSISNTGPASSPSEVAPAGPSDFWYVPILGLVALGLGGYEYYLSRQAVKKPFNR